MDAYTPEKVIEMGKMWSASLFKILPPEEIFSHYRPEEIFSHYRPEEIFSHYRPEEIVSHYRPEEILRQYKPEERMAGLSISELEAYLRKRRQESMNQD